MHAMNSRNVADNIEKIVAFTPLVLATFILYNLFSTHFIPEGKGVASFINAYPFYYLALAFCACWQAALFGENCNKHEFAAMYISSIIGGLMPFLIAVKHDMPLLHTLSLIAIIPVFVLYKKPR